MAIRYILRKNEIKNQLPQDQKGVSFLEVGAGNLKLSSELLNYYKSGVLYEPAPKAPNLFGTLPPTQQTRLILHNRYFSPGDEDPDQFDLVIACEVVEHIDDDTQFISSLLAPMKDDGMLILSAPSQMKYWSYHDDVVGHVRRYEASDIYRLREEFPDHTIQAISYGWPFINILRYARIGYAKVYMKDWQSMDAKQQTEISGTQQEAKNISAASSYLEKGGVTGLMSKVASRFNDRDLSEGYLIIFKKK